MIEKLESGDEVVISWKQEVDDGYSNKRKKKGVVRFDDLGFYVQTEFWGKVRESDLTNIKLAQEK